MGNPNQHATDPLPMVAVGGGAGRGNRHSRLRREHTGRQLWLGVANQYGSSMESFGDSTGRGRAL